MRSIPTDKFDKKDLVRLKAEPWMIKLLEMNPSYVYWGPGEDYMETKEHGWDRAIVEPSWKESGFKELDDLNEVVHFYFAVERSSKECPACKGSGYNSKTAELSRNYYGHTSSTGEGWNNSITQDEVEALVKQGRLWELTGRGEGGKAKRMPTAQEVNEWNRKGIGHDAINKGILVETRAKRLGFYGYCPDCEGHSEVFTAPKAHVKLVLWVLHPRKGCSRGVEISNITKEDLPEIFEYLKTAQERNTARFAKLDLNKVLPKSQVKKSA